MGLTEGSLLAWKVWMQLNEYWTHEDAAFGPIVRGCGKASFQVVLRSS